MKTYWHVTSIDNFSRILREGLRLNSSEELFLFDEKKYASSIAINQCFLSDYALFQIHTIDESSLNSDNVAEFTAHSQWIYDRDIPPSSLKFIGCFAVSQTEQVVNQ